MAPDSYSNDFYISLNCQAEESFIQAQRKHQLNRSSSKRSYSARLSLQKSCGSESADGDERVASKALALFSNDAGWNRDRDESAASGST